MWWNACREKTKKRQAKRVKMKYILMILIFCSCGEVLETPSKLYYSCVAEEIALRGDFMLQDIKISCAWESGYYDDLQK